MCLNWSTFAPGRDEDQGDRSRRLRLPLGGHLGRPHLFRQVGVDFSTTLPP